MRQKIQPENCPHERLLTTPLLSHSLGDVFLWLERVNTVTPMKWEQDMIPVITYYRKYSIFYLYSSGWRNYFKAL